MRVERLSNDQFAIFLTFDDLVERGFTSDDVWYDQASVRELFSEMMYEASSELELELGGMLLVQVYLMQSQGMHVTVTQTNEWVTFDDDFIELKVTLDESHELIFSFDDFEDIIQVVSYLSPLEIESGKIYHMNERYYMMFEEEDPHFDKENIIAIMSEYSNPSIVTSHKLKEYGKVIFENNAVKQIIEIFY